MGDRRKRNSEFGTSDGGPARRRQRRVSSPLSAIKNVVTAVLVTTAVSVAAIIPMPRPRATVIPRRRISWHEHMATSIRENTFRRKYRMSLGAFVKLVELLRPILWKSDEFTRLRTSAGPVPVESRVAISLRLLAGASYLDLMDVHGVAQTTLYPCMWEVIDAINNRPGVGDFRFPQTISECKEFASAFEAKSTNGVISGCVGAVDGLHASTIAPYEKDTLNVLDYFSGNKGGYGINVQAICDANYRFSGVSAIAPGSTNDWAAWNRSKLANATANLPEGFYLLGDAAYPISEQLLTPYPGRELPIDKDSFNFHMSQLRIRVEQSFGIVVQTWGILWRDIKVQFAGRPNLITAIFHLHNFLRDERVPPISASEESSQDRLSRPGLDATGALPERFRTPSQTPTRAGDTPTRNALRMLLDDRRQYRPSWNLERNG